MGQCLDSTVIVMAGPLDHHLHAGVMMAVQGMLWPKLAMVPPTFQDKL